MVLKRDDNGRLTLNILDLGIFLSDIFAECKDEREVEWLISNLIDYTELAAEERKDDF